MGGTRCQDEWGTGCHVGGVGCQKQGREGIRMDSQLMTAGSAEGSLGQMGNVWGQVWIKSSREWMRSNSALPI